MLLCTHTPPRTHIHNFPIYIYIHIHTHMYMYMYIYIYIYIYIVVRVSVCPDSQTSPYTPNTFSHEIT